MPYLPKLARREDHPGAPPGGVLCLLLCLLEFVVVGVVLAPLATGATGVLLHGILVLCGAFVPTWGCFFRSSRTRLISCRNCSGWSTKACASLSGRSRTIAISIAPPSCWKRAGRPSWSLSRIATALFSHSVCSHSSSARRVRAAFWGGTCSRFFFLAKDCQGCQLLTEPLREPTPFCRSWCPHPSHPHQYYICCIFCHWIPSHTNAHCNSF